MGSVASSQSKKGGKPSRPYWRKGCDRSKKGENKIREKEEDWDSSENNENDDFKGYSNKNNLLAKASQLRRNGGNCLG